MGPPVVSTCTGAFAFGAAACVHQHAAAIASHFKSLPHRGQLHCRSSLFGHYVIRSNEVRSYDQTVPAVSTKSSQIDAEDLSDEESSSKSSKSAKKTTRRGRNKVDAETSERSMQEEEKNSEAASPDETKKVKKRGSRKASALANSEEEKGNMKEPKKRGRRKVKVEQELSDGKGENQIKEGMPDNVLDTKHELLLENDGGEDVSSTYWWPPLVCCFGPAKNPFLPSGRPANRFIDHEIHDSMKDIFWSPDKFARVPGGASYSVAVALASIGGQVAFMGKLGHDEYGESMLYHLGVNNVQARAVKIDHLTPTAVSYMKISRTGGLKMTCVKAAAEDSFLQSDINVTVLKEAKMFYFNSSALLEASTRSSLMKALEISKKFGGVIFFDLNLPLPLWASSKETISIIREAWEAADVIEVTKQELEFLCGIEPSEKFDTKDNDKSKFKHHKPEVVMKLWHDNLKVLFVTNGTSKIHYYTEEHDGFIRGMEDPPMTPFTCDMSAAGDAVVAALMSMLTVQPHLVTDKSYLRKAIKHAIKCGVIAQWSLARMSGFLPKERPNGQYGVMSITEEQYRRSPYAIPEEDLSDEDLDPDDD